MLEEWNWLESLPLESLIAMACVMGRSGFKVPELSGMEHPDLGSRYLEWADVGGTMKASEAAKAADAAAKKIAHDNKVKAAKEHKAAVLKENKNRANFRVQLKENFLSSIKYGVTCGKRSTFIYIDGIGSANTPTAAENNFDNHGYKDIIKEVVKEIQDGGYEVTTEIRSNKYRTSHESNVPDYDYYTYQKVYEVKW